MTFPPWSCPCTLCADPAVAVYYLPGGCIAYPAARWQYVCPSHARKSNPRGGSALLAVLVPESEAEFRAWVCEALGAAPAGA